MRRQDRTKEGEWLLKVGVEAILVTVLLLDLEVGHWHFVVSTRDVVLGASG